MYVLGNRFFSIDDTQPRVVGEFRAKEENMEKWPLQLLEKATVTLEGTCEGRNTYILLRHCTLVTSQEELAQQLQQIASELAAEKERMDDKLEAKARTTKPVRPHPTRGFFDTRNAMTFSRGTIVEMVGTIERIREIGDEERLYYTTGKNQQVNEIGGETSGTLYEVTLSSKKMQTQAFCYFRAKYQPQMIELKTGNSLTVRGTVIDWHGPQNFDLKWCVIMP